jgi:23S rRNA pseudouridine1911/1915/1917 synthase
MTPTLHHLVVPETLEGERLDRCLAALGPDWTRAHARRLIDGGHVSHNDRTARPAARVHTGDRLDVAEPPPRPCDVKAEEIPLDVVHEDEDLLVVNKPAGLVIHPAAGNPSGTLVNALLSHCETLSGIGGVERPGIVHRLDKDTSGLLVVAKTDRAHQALSLAFRWRKVSKTYLAICFGVPAPASQVIEAPIARHPSQRQQMAVVRAGRPARTIIDVVEGHGSTALVSCRLVTGRTHQIRVHMAHIGHALVGDPLYSGRQWRNLATPASELCRRFPRQALHAARLAFSHPVSQVEMSFEAPLPADMQALLDGLRSGRSSPRP